MGGTAIPAGDRICKPHKAIWRVADNLVDHLSEIELRPAGVEPLPDRRHASAITTAADLAPFTEHDRPHRLGALLCASAQTPR